MHDPLDPAASAAIPSAGAAGSPPGGAIVKRRLVSFDPATGMPVVQTVPMLTKVQVHDVIAAAAASPYEDPLGLEPQYAGWTNLEVMVDKRVRAAAHSGDDQLVESILDRLIGKPKQSSESVVTKLTYEDTLKEIARQAVSPIDASVVDPLEG